MVALKASQAFKDGVEAGSSRSLYGLGFTSLRVEFLEVRRLARPSFHSDGRYWGFPTWYPHIADTFHLFFSYKLRKLEELKTVLQSPYHDHLFVYVDMLKVGLRFSLHPFIIEFFKMLHPLYWLLHLGKHGNMAYFPFLILLPPKLGMWLIKTQWSGTFSNEHFKELSNL